MKKHLAAVVQALTIASFMAAAGFAWRASAELVALQTELRLLADSQTRLEAQLRGLELWLRDYTIQHERTHR